VTNGCTLDYEWFTPDTPRSAVPVILLHGFQRSVDDMQTMAEHYASWGLEVITVSLCTNSLSGVDHARNGEAAAQLAGDLVSGPVAYAGFSAGGLAAYLAAAQDGDVHAYVGLDPVDSDGLAAAAGAAATFPARAVLGAPGSCNSSGNWTDTLAVDPDQAALRIVAAQHFDFETDMCAGPIDFACSFCAPAGGNARLNAKRLTTAALLLETGAAPEAEAWLEPGNMQFDNLVSSGAIAPL